MRIHFLHIGKTGGTAVRRALEGHETQGYHELVLHDHGTTLVDVPASDGFFFCVRDPVERFVSRFNDRLRQGAPTYDVPWTAEERAWLETFPSADALACHLFEPDGLAAMADIRHLADGYGRWFLDPEYLRARSGGLVTILHMVRLDAEFAAFTQMVGLGALELPHDDVGANRSPADADRWLCSQAIANLRRYFAEDYAYMELFEELHR